MFKAWNDSQALKALCDGVTWSASAYDSVQHQWVPKKLTAGPLCCEVLQEVFRILPLETSPASADGGTPASAGGRPHGYLQWETKLTSAPVETHHTSDTSEAWQKAVSKTLLSPTEMELRYDDSFGCGRNATEAPCERRTCSYCWRNRANGLTHHAVVVFNHWGAAPGEASAGTGAIRGSLTRDAVSDGGWVRSTASRGNDVEVYLTAEDQLHGLCGIGHTTLGKVGYFVEHQANSWRRGNSSNAIPEGEFVVWVAVAEYVTAGVGNRRKVDLATGLDEFKMRQKLSFFPASAIRRVMHMMHCCPTSGASACGLVREGCHQPRWQCTQLSSSSYLLNKYFHSVGRDSIA